MNRFAIPLLVSLSLPGCAADADPVLEPASPALDSRLNDAPTLSRCGPGELPKGPPFDPAASDEGTLAVSIRDSRLAGYATTVAAVRFGKNVDERWQVPDEALGAPEGNSNDVVVLGEGGSITLSFGEAILNRSGPDLCVFENSFSDTFLELGFVEVASSAAGFSRFATASYTGNPLGPFDTIDPTQVTGFAGKYRQGYCTAFDLDALREREEVRSGLVDLEAIQYVRIVDVTAVDGATDCGSRPIYDPYPTAHTAGFDLDAVAHF